MKHACGTHFCADPAAMQITQFSSHGMPCDRRMEDMTMTESRTYLLNNVDIQIVIDELSRFLHTEKGMDVQTAPTPDGYLLQAGQPKDTLRTLSGMRLATTVQFSIVENNLNVTIGEGQWSDKLGAGAVGLFLLWPLAITAGIGAYKQKNLPDEIFHVIGSAYSHRRRRTWAPELLFHQVRRHRHSLICTRRHKHRRRCRESHRYRLRSMKCSHVRNVSQTPCRIEFLQHMRHQAEQHLHGSRCATHTRKQILF